ncbi:MAG: prepilin-type N-terminal cleavage/methylation domain-containing protein [Verrucomicrobiales bacterium]|jgi:prepilin-type N-terminal cleavage/methylation domain-containing protein
MNTKTITQSKLKTAGFSLIELTVAVVVIALVASIGFKSLNAFDNMTRLAKLEKDIRTLNSAINVYRANGGSLTGISSPQEVLNKMKTKASDATVGTVVGLKGRFIDGRLRAVMIEDSEADLTRAVWNSSTLRFELGDTGIGAKEFALDAPLLAIVKEDRTTAVAYGTDDKWVWDYTDVVAVRNGPSSEVPLSEVQPGDPAASGGGSVTTLPTPQFSIPSGTYPAADYPMSLQLTVPVVYAGNGQIIYQIDGGSWTVYTGSIHLPISPTTTVDAYFASSNSDYFSDSSHAGETYLAQFDYFSGSADGKFANATGPDSMDIEILDDGHRFEWGTEAAEYGFTEPNHMTFEGASFEEVEPESDFLIGTLTYYNGTTYSDTTADAVSLNITLDLTSAGIQETLDFALNLESTTNRERQSDDDNADFVRLNTVASQFSTVLNGQTYYLILRFGEHTANGFTTIDEFHVHEGASATGNIYGHLTTTQPQP